MVSLRLERVTRRFPGGVLAVRSLDLQAGEGQLLVIIGPSGCGKTTTLRLIAGLDRPSSGLIMLGGRSMAGVPPHQRGVALVSQEPVVYPHLTVLDNWLQSMRLQRKLHGPVSRDGLPSSAAADHAAKSWLKLENEEIGEIARILRMESMLQRYPGQLSGGEQQRAAIGRALVRRPSVFLLDEPLARLDGPLRTELRRELHLFQRRLGTTMIYVTHDQAEALSLADHLAVMYDGAVIQCGPPQQVYRWPNHRSVAEFLGWPASNFLSGRLEHRDGETRFYTANWSIAVETGQAAAWQAHIGRELLLAFRPEDISLNPCGECASTVTMELALLERSGSETTATLRRGGQHLLSKVAEAPDVRQGHNVLVMFRMENGRMFDPATGKSLSVEGGFT